MAPCCRRRTERVAPAPEETCAAAEDSPTLVVSFKEEVEQRLDDEEDEDEDEDGDECSSPGILSRPSMVYLRRKKVRPKPLTAPPRGLSVSTWNISAINNNPFEYYMTHDDDKYIELMVEYENFVEFPGVRDVFVCDVFTDACFDKLIGFMETEGWEALDVVREAWKDDYRNRPIITGFLKDKSIGAKRLVSMPDRLTNTIRLAEDQRPACRPTVINNYTESMSSIAEWWPQWCNFMFVNELSVEGKTKGLGRRSVRSVRPCELLSKISRSKYPKLTETEELISLALQCLCLAIFDAIVVHMMTTISPDGRWQAIKQSIVDTMFIRKDENTLGVLKSACVGVDVVCLQESAGTFVRLVEDGLLAYKAIAPAEYDPGRDQNSIILLRKDTFPSACTEVTSEVMADLGGASGVEKGDLIAVTTVDVHKRLIMIVSFHGDTNGLATKPVVSAVMSVLGRQQPGCLLIIGLDANAYFEVKEGYLGIEDFIAHCSGLGLRNCWSKESGKGVATTCHARTFLQPQLNKAIRRADKLTLGDQNPKDHVFVHGDLDVLSCHRDNTGERRYVENVCFPTLHFPSDHALVSVVLGESETADERAMPTSSK